MEENVEKEAGGDVSKKKKKVKVKQQQQQQLQQQQEQEEDKKKKKLLKSKKKGSLSELTDEEYDEQTFVEEIKQLPKRNRHAPRRYVSTT